MVEVGGGTEGGVGFITTDVKGFTTIVEGFPSAMLGITSANKLFTTGVVEGATKSAEEVEGPLFTNLKLLLR